jgi:hypothetical protein
LNISLPRQLTHAEWAKIIDAFWTAVQSLLPEPFAADQYPADWVLFKGTGVNVMHRILADCIQAIVQRGGRLSDPEEYTTLLDNLPDLEGVTENGSVTASEFWRSSSAASTYTGRYGSDLLVQRIRDLIAQSSNAVTV